MKLYKFSALVMVGMLVAFAPLLVAGCGSSTNAVSSGSGSGGGGSTASSLSMSGTVVVEDKDLQALGVSTLKTKSLETSDTQRLRMMGMDEISLAAYQSPRLLPMAANLTYTGLCKVLGSDGNYDVLKDSAGKPVTLAISAEADSSLKWTLATTDQTVVEKCKSIGVIPSINVLNTGTNATASFEAMVSPKDVTEAVEKKTEIITKITTAKKVALDQLITTIKNALSSITVSVGDSSVKLFKDKDVETIMAKVIEASQKLLESAAEKQAADKASLPSLVTTAGQQNVQMDNFKEQFKKSKSVTEMGKTSENMMVRDLAGKAGDNTKMQKYMADRDARDFGEKFHKDDADMAGMKEHYQAVAAKASQGDGTVGTVDQLISGINGSLPKEKQVDGSKFADEMTSFIAKQQSLRASGEKEKKMDTYMADGTLYSPVMEAYQNTGDAPVWTTSKKITMGEMKMAMAYLADKKSQTSFDIGYCMGYLEGKVGSGGGSGGGPAPAATVNIRYDTSNPIRVALLPGSDSLILNSRIRVESFDATVFDSVKVKLTYTLAAGGTRTVDFDPPTDDEKNLYERAWYLGDRTRDGKMRGPQVVDFAPNSKATITVTYKLGSKDQSQTIDATLRYIDLSKVKITLSKPTLVTSSESTGIYQEVLSPYNSFDVIFDATGAKDGDDYEIKYAVEVTGVKDTEPMYSSFMMNEWREAGSVPIYPRGPNSTGFAKGVYRLLIQPVAVSKRGAGSWNQRMMSTGSPVITYFKFVDSSKDVSGTEGSLKGTVKAYKGQPAGASLWVGLFDQSTLGSNPTRKPVKAVKVNSDGTYELLVKAADLLTVIGSPTDTSTNFYGSMHSYTLMAWEDYDSAKTPGSFDGDTTDGKSEAYVSSDNPTWFGNKILFFYLDLNRKMVTYHSEAITPGQYNQNISAPKPLIGTLSGVDMDMGAIPGRSSSSSSSASADSSGSSASAGSSSSTGGFAGFFFSENHESSTGGSSGGSATSTAVEPAIASIYPTSGFYQGMTRVAVGGGGLLSATRTIKIGTWEMSSVSDGASYDGTEIKASVPYEVPAGIYDITVTTAYGTSKAGAASKFTVVAKATDAALAAPTITSIEPSSGPAGTEIRVTGGNLQNIKSVKVDSTPVSDYWSESPASLKLRLPSTFTSGPHSVFVETSAGTSSDSASARYTIASSTGGSATSLPVVTGLAPASWSNASAVSVIVSGTALEGTTGVVLVSSDGKTTGLAYSGGTGAALTAKIPIGLPAGSYHLRVTNSAGKSPDNTLPSLFTITTPVTYGTPTMTSMSPSQESGTVNHQIYIIGTDFTGVQSVNVGPNPALSYQFISNTSMMVTTPAVLQPGTYQIVINTNHGSTNGAAAVAQFTIISAATTTTAPDLPVITSVSPSSATEGSTFTISMTGKNFTGAKGGTMGSLPLSNFSVISDTQISASIPAGLSQGKWPIQVVTSAGVNTAGNGVSLTMTAAVPSVTSIFPTSAQAGTITSGVKIIGSSLVPAGSTIQLVNTTSGTSTSLGAVSVNDSTHAYVDIPASVAAGSYNIIVTTSGGSSFPGGSSQITLYQAATTTIAKPVISSFTPASTTVGSSTDVTITGTNLTGVTYVWIGSYRLACSAPSDTTVKIYGNVYRDLPAGTYPLKVERTTDAQVSDPTTQSLTLTAAAATTTAPTTTTATPAVTTATPTTTTTAAPTVTATPKPVISSFSPSASTVPNGASDITITGTNLTGVTWVYFGATTNKIQCNAINDATVMVYGYLYSSKVPAGTYTLWVERTDAQQSDPTTQSLTVTSNITAATPTTITAPTYTYPTYGGGVTPMPGGGTVPAH